MLVSCPWLVGVNNGAVHNLRAIYGVGGHVAQRNRAGGNLGTGYGAAVNRSHARAV